MQPAYAQKHSMTLAEFLQNHIAQHGPMDIGQFMQIALGHPQHGYYMKKDPFGAEGDFTTAPEISQMFGEMIGAWVADMWAQMGKPAFTLLECGPGRGTLMADMLRVCSKVEGFIAACSAHLLEVSPVLRGLQAATLQEHNPQWHETLESVQPDKPLIVIANEFLDALPVRQMQKTERGWKERVVHYDGGFGFGLRDVAGLVLPEEKAGTIIEIAPARVSFVRNICNILQQAGGTALFIDYGYDRPGTGDTLQAVYKHQFVSPLEHIGDADLTAHVDFVALKNAANGVEVSGPVGQGSFLRALGIAQRAQVLARNATDKQKQDIESALHRLTDSGEMGTLFKVMGLHYGEGLRPAGF